jgi:hypothetical protein
MAKDSRTLRLDALEHQFEEAFKTHTTALKRMMQAGEALIPYKSELKKLPGYAAAADGTHANIRALFQEAAASDNIPLEVTQGLAKLMNATHQLENCQGRMETLQKNIGHLVPKKETEAFYAKFMQRTGMKRHLAEFKELTGLDLTAKDLGGALGAARSEAAGKARSATHSVAEEVKEGKKGKGHGGKHKNKSKGDRGGFRSTARESEGFFHQHGGKLIIAGVVAAVGFLAWNYAHRDREDTRRDHANGNETGRA